VKRQNAGIIATLTYTMTEDFQIVFDVVVLGFDALRSGWQIPKFRINILSPYSGLKIEPCRWEKYVFLERSFLIQYLSQNFTSINCDAV
jgi:hypothetical protein